MIYPIDNILIKEPKVYWGYILNIRKDIEDKTVKKNYGMSKKKLYKITPSFQNIVYTRWLLVHFTAENEKILDLSGNIILMREALEYNRECITPLDKLKKMPIEWYEKRLNKSFSDLYLKGLNYKFSNAFIINPEFNKQFKKDLKLSLKYLHLNGKLIIWKKCDLEVREDLKLINFVHKVGFINKLWLDERYFFREKDPISYPIYFDFKKEDPNIYQDVLVFKKVRIWERKNLTH